MSRHDEQRAGGSRRNRSRRGAGTSRASGRGGRGRTSRGGGRRSRGRSHRRQDAAAFWGDASALPEAPSHVRMTPDPAAVARSLGPPPLPGHESFAAYYFDAVYDRAVTTAAALAAAGGLIEPDALMDDTDR